MLFNETFLISSVDNSLTCCLEDIIPDVENRLNFYILQIKEIDSTSLKESIESLLINKIALKEKGIFLTKTRLETLIQTWKNVKFHRFNWIQAEKVLRDSSSTLGIQAISVFFPDVEQTSFVSRSLTSLHLVKRSVFECKNNYVHQLLRRCLSIFFMLNDELFDHLLSSIFSRAESMVQHVGVRYEDPYVNSEALDLFFSLSPLAIVGSSLVASVKELCKSESNGVSVKASCEVLCKLHVDLMEYFCSSSYSQPKRTSLLKMCENINSLFIPPQRYLPTQLELKKGIKNDSKYRDEHLTDADFSRECVLSCSLFSHNEESTVSFSRSNCQCLVSPEVFENFRLVLTTKNKNLKRKFSVRECTESFLLNHVDDEKLKCLYLNDASLSYKKKMLVNELYSTKRLRY